MYEQPTPNLYNKQKIYHWKGQTARIFLPQSYLQGLVKHFSPCIVYFLIMKYEPHLFFYHHHHLIRFIYNNNNNNNDKYKIKIETFI